MLKSYSEYRRLADEIKASKFFDEQYYRKRSGLVFLTKGALALHYVLIGERKGIPPHPNFDPRFYSSEYPDLTEWSMPLLTHYVRHGYSEGRSGNQQSTTSRPRSIKRTIIESGEFDKDFYEQQTGIKFKTNEEAVKHYMDIGERSNFKPSEKFDPKVYRSYWDLRDFEALFYHFIAHGRAEGRVGVYDFDSVVRPGKQQFKPNLPTILIGVHEASLTGAPILGLNIAERMSRDYNVIFWTFRPGPLMKQAASFSVAVIHGDQNFSALTPELLKENVLDPLSSKYDIGGVVVNSVEAAPLAISASLADIPVLSLIHEFATYTAPRTLSAVIDNSQIVLFSSQLTLDAASEQFQSSPFRHAKVFPQGKSIIPDVNTSNFSKSSGDKTWDFSNLRQRFDFICIGCGYVQYRKGVDLFIATAALLKRNLPSLNFAFVWIGDGYSPETDYTYSVWLRDQIKRSDLENNVFIKPAVTGRELEEIYKHADAMLLSSRLDPFPNVAIDAIARSLPVVTFSGANGVAEYLHRDETLAPLVVPYLDIESAAKRLADLAAEPERLSIMRASLRRLADQHFSMDEYVKRLNGLMAQCALICEQERQDVQTILALGRLDRDMLNAEDYATDEEVAKQYVRSSARRRADRNSTSERRPVPGFSAPLYAQTHFSGDEPNHPNAYAHWLRAGQPTGPWTHEVLHLDAGPSKHKFSQNLNIAIQLHLHFPEETTEFLRRISSSQFKPKLLVSVNDDKTYQAVEEHLKGYAGEYEIASVANHGRDIGPFLWAFKDRYQQFDIIGHFHGKRSGGLGALAVEKWRTYIYETMLGGRYASMDQIISAFLNDERLGLVYPENPQYVGWTKNFEIAQSLAPRLKVDALPAYIEFPVGNMFFARPSALDRLFKADLQKEDVPEEPVPYDGTILHAIERLTPLLVKASGYSVMSVHGQGLRR